MLTKRLIACFDVVNGRVTKAQQFQDNIDVAPAEELAQQLYADQIDEIVFYDIKASAEKRKIDLDTVRRVAHHVFVPFTVGGGIRDVFEWYDLHRDNSAWRRAAGVYISILSEPQLFIEGNHRTGALVMSYILAREGRPPFVLTADNARAYLDPSTLITETRKHSLAALFRIPKIKRYFAQFLKEQADRKYLMAS